MAEEKQTPTKYSPNFIKSIVDGARSIRLNLENSSNTNYESTSSFYYDLPGTGLKSTQQVNIDWSKFQNHTFFNSAEVNVNISFDKIVNEFPFNGTKKEYEKFFESLTGYEKWVFDNYPKNVGYLFFSGTSIGEIGTNGTHILVKDYAGSLYPEISKLKSGESVLDPKESSWTFETHLFVPEITNDTQVILQRISGSNVGYTYYLEPSVSTSTCNSIFVVQSGSYYMSSSVELTKGVFNHVALVYDKENRYHKLFTYLNAERYEESTTSVLMESLPVVETMLSIGSGSTFYVGDVLITPTQTFSGALDEFRFFHSSRSENTIKAYAKKSIFSTDDLKIYYKFNEPSGTLGTSETDSINRIVLDSSGNSMHSLIESDGFSFSLRSTSSIEPPITYERFDLSPVLFTSHPDVMELNSTLLLSASQYDLQNPNLITRLIPQHYLIEGQSFDGFTTQQGDIGNSFQNKSIPGSGKIGSTQLMLTFLYIWAKHFDELKIFVDSFSKLHYVDYTTNETTPDNFLPQLYKFLGFKLPPLFLDASIEQYVDSENIEFMISRGSEPLKSVQNQILRRTLVSMGNIIRSKGTQRSIKSFLRTVGIDPDNSFRIREFGGPNEKYLSFAREEKIEPGSWLNFSSSSKIHTPFLTSSRLEPGFPHPVGNFVNNKTYNPHGISNHLDDGLLTSGSWTYEGLYKFPLYRNLSNITQSLARMEVTGTNSSYGGITFNLVAISASYNQPTKVYLYGRPSAASGSSAPLLQTTIDADIFDGDKWNISFGRERGDKVGYYASSSYFLRAASSVDNLYQSSVWFRECGKQSTDTSSSLVNRIDGINNSGSFIVVGYKESPVGTTSDYTFLNNTTNVTESNTRITLFEGQLAQVRFWSKALEMSEWKEHVRNYKSLGVKDPLTNFNFSVANSGSFEKIRLDLSMRQETTSTDENGLISLFDYSQNVMHATGTNFPISTQVLTSDIFKYDMISPYFDEASTNEKVRIRSYQNYDKVLSTPWAETAPLYKLNPGEKSSDNTKFSIEFSLVDALNRDIINIFSTLDILDNIIGNPELIFSPDYPGLEYLRDIYFKRLTDKLNFKSFFEFFRWFETSIGTFIEQLIPRKTKYFGTNFVIESHMLERPKIEYYNNEIYLSERQRYNNNSMDLISGDLRKY